MPHPRAASASGHSLGHQHVPSGHQTNRHAAGAAAADQLLDILDLDAEVLHEYWSYALEFTRSAARPETVRVVDVGSGTGTAALALAQQFPEAEVIAVDISSESLEQVRTKAATQGLSPRIRTVEADLDAGWPNLGELDLTWASMSLHHLADPGRVLRDAHAATRPGGLLAVAEFASPLRFLPDDIGVGPPGFEARTAALLDNPHADALPNLGSTWSTELGKAGWHAVEERDFPIDLDPPRHPKANLYARAWFARLSQHLAEALDPGDRSTLHALLSQDGPHSLTRRTDLHVRGVRTVTLART